MPLLDRTARDSSRQYPSNLRALPQIISIENLGVSYREVEALRNVNLTVKSGRMTGIIGPNGAGKSTFVKAMLGLVQATAGRATFGGRDLARQRDRIAYVPQRSAIDWTFPATVRDVVMMGRVRKTGWFRRFSPTSRRAALVAIERVGMSEFLDRPIGNLSGGQQQRVFLARSLAQEADIFCFDEPFAGVDKKTEAVLFQIFRELADAGRVVLVVNHDLGESIAQFDDLILLNREVIASGSRTSVKQTEKIERAYGGHVSFYAA